MMEDIKSSTNNNIIQGKSIEVGSGVLDPLYLLAIASNGPLPIISSSFLEQPINETEIIQTWRSVVKERDQSIRALIKTQLGLSEQKNSISEQLKLTNRTIRKQEDYLEKKDQEILYYALSKSWRITRLMRKLMNFFRGKING